MTVAVRVAVPATGSGAALAGALSGRVGVDMVVAGLSAVSMRVALVVLSALPVAVSVTGTMAPVAGTAALRGAVAAPRLGRRMRVLLSRGHRPIIARTAGAPCSPRPN